MPRTAKDAMRRIRKATADIQERQDGPTQYATQQMQDTGNVLGKESAKAAQRTVKKGADVVRDAVNRRRQTPGVANHQVKTDQTPSTLSEPITEGNRADSRPSQPALQQENATISIHHGNVSERTKRYTEVNWRTQSRQTIRMRGGTEPTRPPSLKQSGAGDRAFSFARNTNDETLRRAQQTTYRSARSASVKAGRTIKTADRSVKTAQRTVKTGKRAVKTAQRTAKATAKTAQAARRAAVVARDMAIKAAKALAALVKTLAKAAAAAVKAIIAAGKALIAAIVAGGWVVVVIILVVALIAALLFSPIGIFYSAESEDGRSMPEVIAEINADLHGQIEQIKTENAVDKVIVDFEGDQMITNWRDVIAIFAVKTTTDPANGMDVVTLDDARIALLKEVFADMNQLSYRLATGEEVTQSLNPDGTLRTEIKQVTTLTISVSSKSAKSMANKYGFNRQQLELLDTMLSREFRPMYAMLLGSTDGGGTPLTAEQIDIIFNNLPVGTLGSEVVKTAFERLGDPYSMESRGQDDYVDCSYFVWWVYQQLGIDLPTYAAAQGQFCVDNNLTISPDDLVPGDLIFFSHDTNGRFMDITHVAIYCGDGMVIDASASRGEVVYRRLYSGAVLYGRPHILPSMVQ